MENQGPGGKTAGGKSGRNEDAPLPVAPSQQEGSIESVGGGPSGSDESDRSGGGTIPAGGAAGTGAGRDAFISSEVTDKTSVRGRDPRTSS